MGLPDVLTSHNRDTYDPIIAEGETTMTTDRYGLAVSTVSPAALDAYRAGTELLLTMYPGALEAFDRAIAADPNFALAHVAKARAAAMQADMPGARASIAAAQALTAGLTAREASHVAFFAMVLNGQSAAALDALYAHLREWPLDALVYSTSSSPLGLIGTSGRTTLKQEQLALAEGLAPHYGDDWWFAPNHAFALAESGQHARARTMIERSMDEHPANAIGAHTLAHICYEDGHQAAARTFIETWLPEYPRNGLMHGHISWHLALCALQAGDGDAAYGVFRQIVAPGASVMPPFFTLMDSTAFLWRAELAGFPAAPDDWRIMRDFAHQHFPRPGMAFADWHIAMAEAAAGDADSLAERVQRMEELAAEGRYPSGSVVPSVARAFAAFRQGDYATCIDAIEAVLGDRDRAAGSLAQTDLFEFTLLKAYLAAGRDADARRLLAVRRVGPVGLPVAGVAALH